MEHIGNAIKRICIKSALNSDSATAIRDRLSILRDENIISEMEFSELTSKISV